MQTTVSPAGRNSDRLTRIAAVAAVLGVAAVAGWISYLHAVQIVSSHGEPGAVGRAYPVTIDGLIVASSMVLLDAALHKETAPVLARVLLGAGIGATLAVNILAGVSYGPLGAVVSAWPALAFVGTYEVLMMLVRASSRRASPGDAEPLAGKLSPRVPGTAEAAAEAASRATHAAGNPLTPNALQTRFGLPRTVAAEIDRRVRADMNGHGHE